MVVGGAGALGPGTTILLSFLNVGKGIVSSSKNYLVFGSNAKENGLIVHRHVRKLISEIKILQKEQFTVVVHEKIWGVEFQLELLRTDMKMLCFLGEELLNAAKYFTIFANLQLWKRYMRQTLVFMSNIAIRKNFNFCFSAVFCQYQEHLEFIGNTDHQILFL